MATDKEEELKKVGLPEQEVIEQTENELIEGLLFAAKEKFGDDEQKTIRISRGGKLAFSFNVRPLTEDELIRLRKQSTPHYPNPQNRKIPIEGETRYGEFRSRKIYTATVEDKNGMKIWDNPKVKQGLIAQGHEIMETWEIIDKVLLAGEKDAIDDVINDISGYESDLTEYAKN